MSFNSKRLKKQRKSYLRVITIASHSNFKDFLPTLAVPRYIFNRRVGGTFIAAIRVNGSIGAQNRGATSAQFIAPFLFTTSLNRVSEIAFVLITVAGFVCRKDEMSADIEFF